MQEKIKRENPDLAAEQDKRNIILSNTEKRFKDNIENSVNSPELKPVKQEKAGAALASKLLGNKDDEPFE